ncbi:hypothetical protein K466DRAFT_309167 [Polyporus arcularius HHB13444]|uniref:Uncharacterized protein n=1 Tax=Polyporus arcularius HHB13444 TaxID=1314778 RepID=A0A5C3PSH6_9APHY|nr:hypothetical protein K466DRAFT_309167 [Polyporus arcularius HHB13444]
MFTMAARPCPNHCARDPPQPEARPAFRRYLDRRQGTRRRAPGIVRRRELERATARGHGVERDRRNGPREIIDGEARMSVPQLITHPVADPRHAAAVHLDDGPGLCSPVINGIAFVLRLATWCPKLSTLRASGGPLPIPGVSAGPYPTTSIPGGRAGDGICTERHTAPDRVGL